MTAPTISYRFPNDIKESGQQINVDFDDYLNYIGSRNNGSAAWDNVITKTSPWVDVRAYGSINAAVTAIGSTPVVLLVPNAQTLTASLTIPSTLALWILDGGSIVKASTYTLTINGDFYAGRYQVFSGFSSGNVTFGVGHLNEVYPEWWGAVSTTGTNNYTAINSALNCGVNVIRFAKGTYDFDTGLSISSCKTVMGINGFQESIIKYTGSGVAITIDNCAFVTISDIELLGTSSAVGGILYGDSSVCDNIITRSVFVTGFTGTNSYGIRTKSIIEASWDNVLLQANYYGWLGDADCTTLTFRNCQFRSSTKQGAKITSLRGSQFHDCVFENNGDNGLLISSANVHDLDFYNPWFETNMVTSGTSNCVITGSAGDLAKDIRFYGFYNQDDPLLGAGFALEFDYAQQCTLFEPKFKSFSYLKISSHTQNCFCFTSTPGLATGNHATGIRFFSTGSQIATLTVNSATPDIESGVNTFITGNNAGTTITNFLGGITGQHITVILNDANTTINNGGNFVLSSTVSTNGTAVTLYYTGTAWVEISRTYIAHSSLVGLTSGDDHTQYALLAGRAGGQTLIGGTASGDDLTLKTTSNATKGTIFFGNAGTTVYDETNDKLGVGVSSFTSGGAKLETSNGITFPATQVASSNVNTLDDYEEGDATVTMTASTSGTITLYSSFNTISYTKVGRKVTFTGDIAVQSVSSPVGFLTINGLPFTSGNNDKFSSGISIYAFGLAATATTALIGFVAKNSTTIRLDKFSAGGRANLAGDVQADAEFIISGSYFV